MKGVSLTATVENVYEKKKQMNMKWIPKNINLLILKKWICKSLQIIYYLY